MGGEGGGGDSWIPSFFIIYNTKAKQSEQNEWKKTSVNNNKNYKLLTNVIRIRI